MASLSRLPLSILELGQNPCQYHTDTATSGVIIARPTPTPNSLYKTYLQKG